MKQFGLQPWSQIASGHIHKVAEEMLKRLVSGDWFSCQRLLLVLTLASTQREMDEERIFWIPVVEAFPEVRDVYLEMIPNPMDFRTIEDERVPSYQSITEFQDDLILVLGNCLDYNEPSSAFYKIASNLMDMLEETYRGVCDDMRVRFLRRTP